MWLIIRKPSFDTFCYKATEKRCFWHDFVNVTIRREMGSDIDAACGQLRNNIMERTNSD